MLDELLERLSRYSLIERDREAATFNVHRMVREVVKQSLDEAMLRSALVTVEIIEEVLSQGRNELAGQEVMGLCALLEKTGSPRIEKTILRLVRQKSRLTPSLIAKIRRSLDRARERRLSTLINSDL